METTPIVLMRDWITTIVQFTSILKCGLKNPRRGLILNGNQYGIRVSKLKKTNKQTNKKTKTKKKQKQKKNRPIILFYSFVHTANGLELMGSFIHAALLFVHTLVSRIGIESERC